VTHLHVEKITIAGQDAGPQAQQGLLVRLLPNLQQLEAGPLDEALPLVLGHTIQSLLCKRATGD
jgi:hypothetical protein